MIQLDKDKYHLVLKPLSDVAINHLFAKAVVEGHINGIIYVDSEAAPSSFLVSHPYGMSLLFGDTNNLEFNKWLLNYMLNSFKVRNKYEWLQVYPSLWNDLINTELNEYLIKFKDNVDENFTNEKIEINSRVNFKFDIEKYLNFRKTYSSYQIVTEKSNKKILECFEGTVIPNRFWDSTNELEEREIAFCVMIDNKPVSTAFSAFVIGQQLEIGIETYEEYRGNGYAMAVCIALIDYCLQNNYEPIWACKLQNTASFLLAQKLGFVPSTFLPFYRLKV
jgi:hypothetical protein